MTEKNIKSIVPAGYFGQSQQTRRPLGSGPLLQWFNGLPAGRRIAVGWHIQASRCPEQLTQALHRLGTQRITVLHKMSGELVEYWSLETCSLIVLCNGFSDPWEMRQEASRDGIAYGWIAAKNASKMKARVLEARLVEGGYTEPLTITLEGFITEEWFKALSEQFRVLDAFEQLTGSIAPFYGFSITLSPADGIKKVGNKKQSPIVPMVAAVPQRITEDYLEAHLCSRELLDLIAERDLVNKAVRWSIDTSERINRNEDKEAWETPEYEESLKKSGAKAERSAATSPSSKAEAAEPAEADQGEPATAQQRAALRNLWQQLGHSVDEAELEGMTIEEAKALIRTLSEEYKEARRKGNGRR